MKPHPRDKTRISDETLETMYPTFPNKTKMFWCKKCKDWAILYCIENHRKHLTERWRTLSNGQLCDEKMKRKTIADYAVEILKETDNPAVMYGDCGLLDMIAKRCTHTNLMKAHPLNRHSRILTALEKDSRFEKMFIRMNGLRGNQMWRSLKLVSKGQL